jgi:hypothetical protein
MMSVIHVLPSRLPFSDWSAALRLAVASANHSPAHGPQFYPHCLCPAYRRLDCKVNFLNNKYFYALVRSRRIGTAVTPTSKRVSKNLFSTSAIGVCRARCTAPRAPFVTNCKFSPFPDHLVAIVVTTGVVIATTVNGGSFAAADASTIRIMQQDNDVAF